MDLLEHHKRSLERTMRRVGVVTVKTLPEVVAAAHVALLHWDHGDGGYRLHNPKNFERSVTAHTKALMALANDNVRVIKDEGPEIDEICAECAATMFDCRKKGPIARLRRRVGKKRGAG